MKIRLLMRPEKVVEKLRYSPDGVDLLDEFLAVKLTVAATEVLPHPKSGESLCHSVGEECGVICLRGVQSNDIAGRLHPPDVAVAENHPYEPSKVSIGREVILPGKESGQAPVSF